MTVVLGVDAAWTATEPSGVALVSNRAGGWKVLAVAPSYESFVQCATGQPVDWTSAKFCGSAPDIGRLLAAASNIAWDKVAIVAIDMPIATVPFAGRRQADNAISAAFGARACSTHSPTHERPGRIRVELTRDLHRLGYPLATAAGPVGTVARTIEVYPHPALLSLVHRDYRVPYKVARSTRYWPNADKATRIRNLLVEMAAIDAALRRKIGDTGVPLPQASSVGTLASLKKYEDALDALVSAWVGVRYLDCAALPYGDETAAIWIPN